MKTTKKIIELSKDIVDSVAHFKARVFDKVEGRAYTYKEKRAVMEKILAGWAKTDHQRLGQFLDNLCKLDGGADLFNKEDLPLAELAVKYGEKK